MDILQNRASALRDRIILLGMALRDLEELEKQEDAQENSFAHWVETYVALGQNPVQLEGVKMGQAISSNLVLTVRMCERHNDPQFEEIAQQLTSCFHPNEVQDAQTPDNEGMQTLSFVMDTYVRARKTLYNACNVDAMLENIMVNYLFSKGMPFEQKDTWREYQYFCQLCSYLHFAAIGCYAQHESMEKLVCDLTVCYRAMVHNGSVKEIVVGHMQQNDCTTLAHMAMLVSG